ncbi:unnamed protein product [Rangifer tarandus platyrhynchus]|uniref:Uncharacterized protein n=1 Tax=Rangifer tarandus platyrhynchus TaxID=3082113 RepID=A0ABN8XJJ2_RANTA|nr:unnamed protein product [Rangifer tarandus platyrhynchus]
MGMQGRRRTFTGLAHYRVGNTAQVCAVVAPLHRGCHACSARDAEKLRKKAKKSDCRARSSGYVLRTWHGIQANVVCQHALRADVGFDAPCELVLIRRVPCFTQCPGTPLRYRRQKSPGALAYSRPNFAYCKVRECGASSRLCGALSLLSEKVHGDTRYTAPVLRSYVLRHYVAEACKAFTVPLWLPLRLTKSFVNLYSTGIGGPLNTQRTEKIAIHRKAAALSAAAFYFTQTLLTRCRRR